MNYVELFRKSGSLVWQHKFLILLGIISVLAGGGGANTNYNTDSSSFQSTQPPYGPSQPGTDQFTEEFAQAIGFIIIVVAIVLCIALLAGLVFAVLSAIARGGMIAGVNELEGNGSAGFEAAWGEGWQRGWRLFAISIPAAIPGWIGIILVVVIIISALFTSGLGNPTTAILSLFQNTSLILSLVGICCVIVMFSWALNFFQLFAERACVLENEGIISSFRRGFQIMGRNFGQALVLYIVQTLIRVIGWLIIIIPLIFVTCLFWPATLLVSGFVESWFSTVWTLAWRQWVGEQAPDSLAMEGAPAG